jgi:hypothetical protein
MSSRSFARPATFRPLRCLPAVRCPRCRPCRTRGRAPPSKSAKQPPGKFLTQSAAWLSYPPPPGAVPPPRSGGGGPPKAVEGARTMRARGFRPPPGLRPYSSRCAGGSRFAARRCAGGAAAAEIQRRGAQGQSHCAKIRLPHRHLPRIRARPEQLCAHAQGRAGAAVEAPAPRAQACALSYRNAHALLRARAVQGAPTSRATAQDRNRHDIVIRDWPLREQRL